jgi:hypothetical protein
MGSFHYQHASGSAFDHNAQIAGTAKLGAGAEAHRQQRVCGKEPVRISCHVVFS